MGEFALPPTAATGVIPVAPVAGTMAPMPLAAMADRLPTTAAAQRSQAQHRSITCARDAYMTPNAAMHVCTDNLAVFSRSA